LTLLLNISAGWTRPNKRALLQLNRLQLIEGGEVREEEGEMHYLM